jgi:hypothetical protein
MGSFFNFNFLKDLKSKPYSSESRNTSGFVFNRQGVSSEGKIEANSFFFDNIYPLDLITSSKYGGNFMVFYINEQKELLGENAKAIKQRRKYRTIKGELITENERTVMVNRSYLKNPKDGELNRRINRTTITTGGIALYIPSTVEVASTAGYEQIDLNFIIGAPFRGESANRLDWIKNAYDAFLSDTAIKLGGLAAAGAAAKILSEFSSTAGTFSGSDIPDKIRNAVLLDVGKSFNPFREIMFKGVDFRNFSFTFTFFPRNQKESIVVNNIINLFQYHMLPEEKDEFGGGRFWVNPSDFDIEFYKFNPEKQTEVYENPFLPPLSTCILKNVSVNFVPNGEFLTHEDGAPLGVSLRLEFTETEVFTKTRFKEIHSIKFHKPNISISPTA